MQALRPEACGNNLKVMSAIKSKWVNKVNKTGVRMKMRLRGYGLYFYWG
jgi:hypothetical protein